MRVINRFQEYFVPISLAMDPEGLRKGRVLVIAAFFLVCYSLLFGILFAISGFALGVAICLTTLLASVGVLFYYRRYGRMMISGHLFLSILFCLATWFAILFGGIKSAQMAWYLTLPITAFLIMGQAAGYIWTMVTMVGLLGFFIFTPGQALSFGLSPNSAQFLHFIGLAGLVLYILLLVDVYERGRKLAMEQLDRAQRKIMSKNKMLEAQKRAIKTQNNAIFEQNNVLEQQYDEIVNINSSLERIIHERTFRLKEALHDLDIFLYESSHALRRPVSSILGLLQVIRLETDDELRHDLTMRLEDTVRGMDSMLQKLIFINTINQEYDLDESVNLPITVKQICEKHIDMIQQRDIEVKLDIRVDRHTSSQHLLFVMLDNLLENAFNYSDATGRRKAVVEVVIQEVDEQIKVTISDNGIGIPAQCKDRVFDLFYRASIMSTGNGLGLYMVKKVVEKLGGTIKMRSEERAFTAFELTFPVQVSAKKKLDLPESTQPKLKLLALNHA